MSAALPADFTLPRAVLFDMDGVIVDSETLYRGKYFELLEAAGHQADDARFLKLVGQGWKETVGALEADFPGLDGAEFVERWKRACHPDQGGQPELKPGVGALLDLLEARGIAAAIATGSQRAVAHGFLDHHALRHRFAAIVAHEDAKRGKPHPDPFLGAAAAVDVVPADCLVLEDSANGVRAAAAAGMPVIFVPDLIAPSDEIERRSLAVVRDLNEVARWLAALQPPATRSL